ncbi:hypothetical protein ACN469_11835 [Corallococcus terminator]
MKSHASRNERPLEQSGTNATLQRARSSSPRERRLEALQTSATGGPHVQTLVQMSHALNRGAPVQRMTEDPPDSLQEAPRREETVEVSGVEDALERSHPARLGILTALQNLEAYGEHLATQEVTPEVLREVLAVEDLSKMDPDLLTHVDGVLKGMLMQEQLYVAESRESLHQQLAWHLGGAEDKGLVSPEMRDEAYSSVTKEDLRKDNAKSRAKYRYYEPIRHRLMSMGFVVSPPGTALGAVFPERDWVRDIPSDTEFWPQAKAMTDELTLRYQLLGDDSSAVTRLLKPPEDHAQSAFSAKDWRILSTSFASAVGCLCVSWTKHQEGGKRVYVPVLGVSGVVQEEPQAPYFQKFNRHLGLPAWDADTEVPSAEAPPYEPSSDVQGLRARFKELSATLQQERLIGRGRVQPADESQQAMLDEYNGIRAEMDAKETSARKRLKETHEHEEIQKGLEVNYETMLHRANFASLEHRARGQLRLRSPARQALLSYVSFREKKTHEGLKIEEHPMRELDGRAQGVDLWLSGWHSLTCAEPAALMTAASYFCDGADVLVCFPYEGFQKTGTNRNRPKETCAWCAAVELGFRSVSSNPKKVDESVDTGTWLTQFTIPTELEPPTALPVEEEFDAFDDANPITTATRRTLAGRDAVGLVRNTNLEDRAYSDVVETKIGRMRSMYHLLGLLDPEVIALDRPLFGRRALDGPRPETGRSSIEGPRSDAPTGEASSSEVRHEASSSGEPEVEDLSAEARYRAYVNRNFALVDNPGGGDCLYYAFADGVNHRSAEDASKLPGDGRAEESMHYRQEAAAMTATLIRRGIGISPAMFRDMKPSSELLELIAVATARMEQVRGEAWQQVRQHRGLGDGHEFRDTDENYQEEVAEAEARFQELLRANVPLGELLNVLATAYEDGQGRGHQWAGDLDFRSLVLARGVNLRMHYVDNSPEGLREGDGHRVDEYNFRELSARYLGEEVDEATDTIDVFHQNDNHYVAGRPL